MQRLLGVAAVLFFQFASLHAQTGEITGRVVDEKGEGLPFANVIAEQDGKLVTGAQTDFDGYFTIKPLNPGKYDVKVSYLGEDKAVMKGVMVSADKITELNLSVTQEKVLGIVTITEYKVPLIDKENNSTKNTITSEEIQALPTKNVNSIASLSAGVYQSGEGKGLNIKGAREEGTEYYIDGIRVRGSAKIPAQGIEELTVITGGVPAKYGDATGGIVTITTRGPSRNFAGSIEGTTSQGMDAYGYNLGSFDLTGPIIKKNKGRENEKTIAGFFIAGEYLRQEDASPSATGVYKAKEDSLRYLEENPLTPSPVSEAFIVTTETVTKNSLEKVKTKPNVVNNNYTLSGKLDFKLTDAINLTFGGNYNYVRRHDWIDRYTLFNYVNNPFYKETSWRVFGRFTQRFGQKETPEEEAGTQPKRSAFQNAFYSVQFDYSKVYDKFEDDSHGFSPFDYGYIGNFEILRTPVFDYGFDQVSGKTGWKQLGYRDTLVRFAPADVNPTGTAFTDKYYELAGATFSNGWWTAPLQGAQTGFYETLSQIQVNGGLLNGDRPRVPHDIWFNTGRQFNGYGISNDDDQYRLSILGSVDIVPGGSARNKHAFEFGLEFEQRVDRGYNVASIGLWELMRQLANKHIDQLDTDHPYLLIDGEIYSYDDPNAPDFGQNDTIIYDRKYVAGQQAFFDKQIRKKLGLAEDNTDLINIDGLPPDFYSLDMFSADELLNNGNPYAAWHGYDYLGNKLSTQPSFDDFFKQKDANGNYTRAIGAFRPIYASAFIQDKFNFKDLLFNIGFRIDRFDANQKVLKDKYLLYQAYTVGEVRSRLNGTVPLSIGDDYVVYVDDFNKSNPVPVGYRNEDTWYTSDGTETNDPSVIAKSSSTGRITPYLVNPNDNIKNEDFEPSSSFKDYEPQITVMPRLAFSFNITDEASFFAHYDILTQRPQSREQTTPDVWYFFDENVTTIINNPSLKPEKTIDYQLGFRQLLTSNSAITISAFYREMKDMIQIVNIPYAYPRDYKTFGNVDFGTVKGFSVSYDLRKTSTSNIALKANYTIQFAEGTGSNTTSQLNLVGSGQPNLRTIVPLDYDSRHNINVTIDYSYGEGKDYNGPKIKDREIFANSGINITARARSGEPYTQQENPTAEALRAQATRKILTGSINGSRLPWKFTVDFRLWKDFKLNNIRKKTEGEEVSVKKTYYLNVYLLIQNLLNTLNVVSVYPYTGNAGDDGYLTSSLGQQDLAGQTNAASYEDLYRAYLDSGLDGNSNSRYSLPRSIRIGAIFKF
ncbi:MAG TPA: carboxypeptidase regulatory-like domain-containing protein [Chitinophagales bacterium]|nr:carboxypeptidase regulatory-like domain-containing protein [Chitinophagales bacterium]